MRRLAKILIAGTLLATPMLALSAGTATSQTLPSTVDNDQVQLGDVFATQHITVVDPSQATTAVTTASGNGVQASVPTGVLVVRSDQDLRGNVISQTLLGSATGGPGVQVQSTTSSTGNSGDWANADNGEIRATLNQSAGNIGVTAYNTIYAPHGSTQDASTSSQAVTNSQAVRIFRGDTDVTVNQTAAGITQSGADVYLSYVGGTGAFASTAVANDASTAGQRSTQKTQINQLAAGSAVKAFQTATINNGQSVQIAATSTANNAVSTNADGPMDLKVDQNNYDYTRAQAVLWMYDYGTATAQAMGVGNSTFAAETGPTLTLDNAQDNGSDGVEVISSVNLTNGFDATSSATAMGNAVTGYACSDCHGVMSVKNSQTNGGDVSATSSLTINGSNRTATSVATASGNNATFFVSH